MVVNVRGKAVVRGGRYEPRRRTRVNHRRRVVKPGGIKTRVLMLSWDESEGNLSTALAVPGMKMARAWLGLCNGTGELLGATWVLEDWNRNSPGDRQVANPRVAEYRARARRAERLVVVMKCL
jgi:hypothetical protein